MRLIQFVVILVIMAKSVLAFSTAPLGQLKLVRSVPGKNDDTFFLAHPVDMIVSDHAVFISDQSQSRIFKLDLEGRFVKCIGKRGQGPGEFSMQSAMALNSDFLAVEDQGNRRVQLFSPDGEFISVYRQALLWMSGVFLDGQLLVNPALPRYKQASPVKTNLLLFDLKGQLLRQVGEPFVASLRGPRFDMANQLILKKNEEGIVVAQYFGNIVRVYNEDLDLEDEFLLQHPEDKKIMGYAFDAMEGNLYVAAVPSYNVNRIVIHVFSISGEFLGELDLKQAGEKIIPKSIAVIRRGNKLWFYILIVEPETKLLIATCS